MWSVFVCGRSLHNLGGIGGEDGYPAGQEEKAETVQP